MAPATLDNWGKHEGEEVKVTTSHGTCVGTRHGSLLAFRGVPYARAARLRVCEPPRPYGRLRCVADGPQAPQPVLETAGGLISLIVAGKGRVPRRLPANMSEQACLNLQVYVPEATGALPVFVFVHGGAFIYGSNSDAIYQHKWGCKLAARRGIAVVLVNYRLGPLGFLKVPGGEANLGVRDVIAALRWVREEGPNFGLDPEAVTVGGESAGAMITGALLRAPAAKGLFRRAVLMSGSPEHLHNLADAEAVGRRFAERVDPGTAPVEEVLRTAVDMVPAFGFMPFQPCLDGEVLVDGICAEGVEVLAGVTRNEFLLFYPKLPIPMGDAAVARRLSEALGPSQMDCSATDAEVEEAIAALRREYETSARPFDVFRRLSSCVGFEAPLLAGAEALKERNTVYLYRNMLGPGHAGELGYVFGTWNKSVVTRVISGLPPVRSERSAAIGRAQERLWGEVLSSFVCSGRPTGVWPAYGAGDQRYAVALAPNGQTLVPAATASCERMCALLARRRHAWGFKHEGNDVGRRARL